MSSPNPPPTADKDGSKPAFAHAPSPLPTTSRSSPIVTPLSPRRLHPRPRACASGSFPNSPSVLVQAWAESRSISSTLDLSRNFVSILLLSNRCRRAAFAEKQLLKTAERYSVSRKLLVLSAGLFSEPGEMLPPKLIAAARDRDIDLSDERPCAAFSLSDLADRNVRDKLMVIAETHAHKSGGHLYQWERKIRLLCDFENALPRHQGASGTGMPLDVPSFNTALHASHSLRPGYDAQLYQVALVMYG
ncbi:Phosphotyrosine protein phosphatase I [Gracilaria domingensis]|nr:Phosphotyrosine protein phosphatase I [Gracilaria domingensis]